MAVDVDDHVTVDNTAGIAATIDVPMLKAAVQVFVTAGNRSCQNTSRRNGRGIFTCTGINGVPLQALRLVIYVLPPLRFNLQTADRQLHLVAGCGIRCADKSARIVGIVISFRDDGIVATAHQLVEDNQLSVEVHGLDIVIDHATHIAAAVKRANISRVVHISGRIVVNILIIKVDARNNVHCTTLHIFFEDIILSEVQCAEIHRSGRAISIRLVYVARILC